MVPGTVTEQRQASGGFPTVVIRAPKRSRRGVFTALSPNGDTGVGTDQNSRRNGRSATGDTATGDTATGDTAVGDTAIGDTDIGDTGLDTRGRS